MKEGALVKKALLIIGLLIFVGLLAYGLLYWENKTRTPERVLVINYQKSGGLAGVEERWLICSDGFVRVTTNGSEGRGNVRARAVADLLKLIKKEGFYSFKDSYGFPSNCNDCFTYRVAVNVGGGGKVVWKVVTTVDGADAPAELWSIIGELNKLISSIERP